MDGLSESLLLSSLPGFFGSFPSSFCFSKVNNQPSINNRPLLPKIRDIFWCLIWTYPYYLVIQNCQAMIQRSSSCKLSFSLHPHRCPCIHRRELRRTLWFSKGAILTYFQHSTCRLFLQQEKSLASSYRNFPLFVIFGKLCWHRWLPSLFQCFFLCSHSWI